MAEIFTNQENRYCTGSLGRLRRGVTTGSCAAGAVYASMVELLLGKITEVVRFKVPAGIEIILETVRQTDYFENENCVCYGVYKDSGDDPDVTAGTLVQCVVSAEPLKSKSESPFEYELDVEDKKVKVFLSGGEGVGIVTKEGLEIEVGRSAINKVPRQMIIQQVGDVLIEAAADGRVIPNDIFIIVDIPEGRGLAERTFNGALGIEGGLSVLGTTGIIEPMSNQALVDTICVQIRQRYALGYRRLYLSPGNHGSRYLTEELSVKEEMIVKCSNYIGEAIDCAVDIGFEELVLVGDVGKLCKLAAGIFNTHSHTADGRGTVFALHYLLCGKNEEVAREIMTAISTQAMMDILVRENILGEVALSIMDSIGKSVEQRSHNKLKYKIVLFSTKYGFFGEKSGDVKR